MSDAPQPPPGIEALRALEQTRDNLRDQAQRLLGEGYDKIAKRHHRSLASSTPPKKPHRLMRLFDELDSTIAHGNELLTGVPAPGTGISWGVVELGHTLDLLEDASRILVNWDEIQHGASDSDFFEHLILTLSFQNIARNNWRWDVRILPEDNLNKMPDLALFRGEEPSVFVEVKSKHALKDAVVRLNYEDCRKIVGAAIREATGTTKRGQLGRDVAGLLVIGGFYIQPAELNLLYRAAREWFQRKKGRRSLAGVLIASSEVYNKEGPILVTPLRLTPSLTVYLAENPYYTHRPRIRMSAPTNTLQYPEGFERWPREPTFEVPLISGPRTKL